MELAYLEKPEYATVAGGYSFRLRLEMICGVRKSGRAELSTSGKCGETKGFCRHTTEWGRSKSWNVECGAGLNRLRTAFYALERT